MLTLAAVALATAVQPAAANPPAAKAASSAPPALVLTGEWRGREVGGAMGVRYPRFNFGASSASLVYADGGTGTLSVKVDSVVVKGAKVSFAVPGPGKRRHYRGTWDGKRITGTIAHEPNGPAIAEFELERPLYEDSPHLALLAQAVRAGAAGSGSGTGDFSGMSAGRANEPPAYRVFEPAGSVPEPRQRDDGSGRVNARLSAVAGAPGILEMMMDEYSSQCPAPPSGVPLFEGAASAPPPCGRMLADIGRVAASVQRVLDAAEDDARRLQLRPGTVRDLRAQNGVDEGDWDRAVARLRGLEAEAARGR